MELQGKESPDSDRRWRRMLHLRSNSLCIWGNNSFLLEELEKEALAGRVPIIRKEMQSFLKMFLAATRPMKILEVGTAVGFFHSADVRIWT